MSRVKEQAPPVADGAFQVDTPAVRSLRRRRYGIHAITFEESHSPQSSRILLQRFDRVYRELCITAPYGWRLLREVFAMAPLSLAANLLCTLWLSVSSAVNLYFLSFLFSLLEDSFTSGKVAAETYKAVACGWLTTALLSVAVEHIYVEAQATLRGHLRAHFIPQLIRAGLRADLPTMQGWQSVFPVTGNFDSEIPGWSFLQYLLERMRTALTLLTQVMVLVYAISRKQSPEKELLIFFCIAHPVIRWLAPPNGIGSKDYIFWTDNRYYHHLKALYHLTFSTEYRGDLILDGVTSSIAAEYSRSSEALGIVTDAEPYPWVGGLLRSWYWDFLINITLDLPLAIYVLTLPSRLSPSSVTSMALLQQATTTLSRSIGRWGDDQSSVIERFSQAKWLYEAIAHESRMPMGTASYPEDAMKFSAEGMSISFKDVSLRYPKRSDEALHKVSFDVAPGQLVLVVGVNGSGKSSMLKLLARLFDPTSGQILIDGKPHAAYKIDELRESMSFLSQSPVVYPLSVRENICIGLGPRTDKREGQIAEAARMGGSSGWISKLEDGYDTLLQPSYTVATNWVAGFFGQLSDALRQEYDKHTKPRILISGGEQQRLAASRTFMKINNGKIKLVVVDEATSSLDPVAERDLLTQFLRVRNGKTMIFVTHRFQHLARKADQIICLKDGHIVEHGTHDELMHTAGEYAELYNAQAKPVF
ncbi:P-loop containing nucleoside triphosphate hydrolase protein [Hygrophoropsis aurantiaca]|uniref:P-loop containing nucleoside triphosphate hydrolase protein n=1 Tax=Hygrophoropsis aurantiaca TaxID=72124 RepID=A0ACB7ZVX0_9AGAM|nr:P-loop containing nucleoside triphosphate hydrolase protein [Hygrophoropsis aurantiaca]